ncbi:Dps family protein [Synechococcus sp. PCC 7336]|uniref:Dps family protein n=1 Tax=Synechococcus sp. PCC 7336 TaxID=195250 RepID=UPI00034AFCB9|nr:Dps family protein [Synechococcus sp. PCC 7336]
MRSINIGLSDEQRQGVIDLLNQDLSDAYLLLVKTKKYHWDVVGPQFRSLHELWDEHYEALSTNIDAYAERVRALGGYPVGTVAGFLQHATIGEHPGDIPNTTQMVSRLMENHETIIRNLRQHLDACSKQFHDEGTADFLTGMMEQHEEMAWMLRSFIEGQSLEPSNIRFGIEDRQPAGTN